MKKFIKLLYKYIRDYPLFHNLFNVFCFFLVICFYPMFVQSQNLSSIQKTDYQISNSTKITERELYLNIPWTEPLVIRKDYDLFKILLKSKIPEAVSLSWTIKLNISGIQIERDGEILKEITLYDDGTNGDQLEGDRLYTIDRLMVQGVIPYYGMNGIAAFLSILPSSSDIKFTYPDGHSSIFSQNQVLDRLPLAILVLNPESIENIPTIWQITDSMFVTDYAASVIVPLDTQLILNEYVFPNLLKVSNTFYKYINDDIDFLNFNCKPICQTGVWLPQGVSYGAIIKNDASGFDIPIVDYSSFWGSNRLQWFYPINNGYLETSANTHELLHRWVSTITRPLEIMQDYASHWGYIKRNSTGFGGLTPYNGVAKDFIKENDSIYCGTYSNGTLDEYYFNDLELYLMGLMDIDEVEFPLVTFPKGTPINDWDRCYQADTLRLITKDEFISALGTREPSFNQAQKDFRLGEILVSTRKLSETEMIYHDQIMRIIEMPQYPSYGYLTFEEATGNRATMSTRLTRKNNSEINALPTVTQSIQKIYLEQSNNANAQKTQSILYDDENNKSNNLINNNIYTQNLDLIFYDYNGDAINYSYLCSDTSIVKVIIEGAILSIHPVNVGSATIIILGDDRRGGTTQATFIVTVSLSTNIDQGSLNGFEYSIFPNPNKGIIRLRIENKKLGEFQVQIINELGQIQLEKELHIYSNVHEEEIDLSHLLKGSYFIKVFDGVKSKTKKIILK